MTKKSVTRYYCDHCRKGGFKKPDMAAHELICFQNPHRNCPECDRNNTDVEADAKFFADHGKDKILTRLDGCPACTLAAIMFHNKKYPDDFFLYDAYKEDMNAYRSEKIADCIPGWSQV